MVNRLSFEVVGNNLVQRYTSDQYSAPMSNVLEYIKERLGGSNEMLTTPTLPLGCRAYFKQGQLYNYLVEVPPGKHPFNYSFYEDEDNELAAAEDSVEVVMPWQYFLFAFSAAPENNYGISANFNSLKLFWSKTRFVDWNTRVFSALVPNINGSAVVCLGDAFPESTKSVCDRIEAVVNEFYDHTFNNDLGRLTPYEEDIDTWVRESERSRLCYMDWRVSDFPIKDYLGFNPEVISDGSNTTINQLLAEAIQRGQPAW